ncbi:hypothetical protein G5714_006849 [Onychostoma macrolepis]|uniref:Uncharacterized protein n=1 Tax=Onychostoma macrolepis TaxID=369639 RepID=A0A7J6CY64_9TELE|nr:hypothetical protein G5714_006849 [Onychostoma macrolepis]
MQWEKLEIAERQVAFDEEEIEKEKKDGDSGHAASVVISLDEDSKRTVEYLSPRRLEAQNVVISFAASQIGDSGLGICYCLFQQGPEAQNVDVSVSRDGRLRTSVSTSVSPLQAGDSERMYLLVSHPCRPETQNGVSAIVSLDGRLRTEVDLLQSYS